MNILAVIPARAGSKGIPNKNVRIVAGRPLIYYSIKNALDSDLITDVVVTTDSDQVRIIAEQMGARVRMRSSLSFAPMMSRSMLWFLGTRRLGEG